MRSSLIILCLHPDSIPNPNFGIKPKVGDFNSLKDCSSRYIRVPCGWCSECVKLKQLYLIQRCQMESMDKYMFFCTLTYDDEHLPSLVTSTGYELHFVDWKHVQNMLKRVRKSIDRPLKYLAVTERGSKRGRPHVHILFFLSKLNSDTAFTPYSLEHTMFTLVRENWSVNVGSNRHPKYESLFTYKEIWIHGAKKTNYDLHYVVPSYNGEESSSNVSFYVTKYMLKPSNKERRLQQALHLNLSDVEYHDVWNLVKSRCICSKGFGLCLDSEGNISDLVLTHLRKGIEVSEDFPKFFNPSTGQSFPLSKYYRSKGDIYKFSDALRFYMDADSDSVDSVPDFGVPEDVSVVANKVRDFEQKSDYVFNRGLFDNEIL